MPTKNGGLSYFSLKFVGKLKKFLNKFPGIFFDNNAKAFFPYSVSPSYGWSDLHKGIRKNANLTSRERLMWAKLELNIF